MSRQDAVTGRKGSNMIEARDLWKIYRIGEIEIPAVRGVSLSIPAGQFVTIMGPSGSGKSTFMHLIGCLDRCDRGQYFLGDSEITGLSRNARAQVRNRKIGFVFQNFNLLARTTAIDNVALPLAYQGLGRRDRRRRAVEMLERLGLGDRMLHHPNQLSGGQQQRVAIARALITEPFLLLADEPTGNLDSRTGVEIMALLQKLNRETGLTIVLVTHEANIAAFTERAVTFQDGRVTSDILNENVREASASAKPFDQSYDPFGTRSH
ncbi:MAG: ABC transporter ATP-binding protein [Planctomycetota bacterium]|nr:ABC transporter ATP-binding protein [Planctomycetota bacterium]MCZ6816728.1 ABC transporter ATP-binding protein [Planctomycetota bacterium]